MRYGRKKSREQVRFLVRFLEEWCGPEELTERIRRHISLAKSNDLHAKGAYYLCEALAQCSPTAELQDELITSTRDYLAKTNPDLAEVLSPSDKELFSQAFSIAKKDVKSGLRKLRDIQCPDPERWNLFGLIYLVAKEPGKAESYFTKAVEKGDAEAMNNLATLYWIERKDLDAAEKYYLLAVEKRHFAAMNHLSWFYFQYNREKSKALQLARRSVEISKHAENTHTLAVCLLWDDHYKESVEMFLDFLEFDPFDGLESDITLYLIFLLAKKQHHLLLDLFEDELYRLKERFKPVYFALMHRMQDDLPKEYKKMGGELRQTVEEILAEADKMARDR